jgi:hypothetical protein
MKKWLIYFLGLFFSTVAIANDGMWLPHLLKKLNEPEMKSLGMRISAEDIYSINKSSIKDAVVHFGGGCTGEIVSSKGLLLTNHHCGYGQIVDHSTMENNYLKNGFWAASYAEELPNPGLSVTFIRRIEDVTKAAMEGVTAEMNEREKQAQIDKNLEMIRNKTTKKASESVMIRPFFEGNEYYLFVTATFKDVRLVGTPPDFIGKYGADTDNWIWPRHTGDFAVFRVYAGPDNEPAEYSPDNKPYEPGHFLPVSTGGLKENDFLMVLGFPARTDQYLHSAAIEMTKNTVNPTRVSIRDKVLEIMDEAMRRDPVVKLQYADKQSRISNGWKKWKGESLGLERSHAIRERKSYEREFHRRVQQKPKFAVYAGLLDSMEAAYKQLTPLTYQHEVYQETMIRHTEIARMAGSLMATLDLYDKSGEAAFEERRKAIAGQLEGYFKDYQMDIDRRILAAMLQYYTKHMPENLHGAVLTDWKATFGNDWDKVSKFIFSQSSMTSKDNLTALLQLDYATYRKKLEEDPLCQMLKDLGAMYKKDISPGYNQLQEQVNAMKRTYMQAQREVFQDRKFYPDANRTMRVSYGQVKGYEARDAVYFEPFTTIDGVLEKYVPGDYEFDLDERFRTLVKERNFGPYGNDGSLTVNFLGNVHTTGGNSGSPVLNADGHLVGLLFDGAWEGVMSDIYYSDALVRSIMLDIRYVLWVMDVYAGARHLVDEMSIAPSKKP